MKRNHLLTIALLTIIFSSCKKDYTCECTITVNDVNSTIVNTLHTTKKNAKEKCTAEVVAPITAADCKLK